MMKRSFSENHRDTQVTQQPLGDADMSVGFGCPSNCLGNSTLQKAEIWDVMKPFLLAKSFLSLCCSGSREENK